MPYYLVTTSQFGDILKKDDNITAARAWALAAFGHAASVARDGQYRLCEDCLSAPCCCSRKDTDR